MKKEDNTKLTVDEILEEIENAGLDTPKMQCSICGKEKPAHAVYTCRRSGATGDGWRYICWVRRPGRSRWTRRR